MRSRSVLIIAMMLLVAGCTGSPAGDSTPTDLDETLDPDTESTPTATEEPTPQQTATDSNEISTPSGVSDANPYGQRMLLLYVNQSMMDRNVTPMVQNATAFWEANAEEYAGYNVSFRLTDVRSRADIYLEFRNVEQCGITISDQENLRGCGEIPKDVVDPPLSAYVQHNLSNPGLDWAIKHELGHTLGVEHGPPEEIMSSHSPPITEAEPMSVHIRGADGDVPYGHREEINQGLDYFTNTDELNDSERLEWQSVESVPDAHLVIVVGAEPEACGFRMNRYGWCLRSGDYHSQFELRFVDTPTDQVAWFVGRALSPWIFEEDEVPEDLQGEQPDRVIENWPET